MADLPAGIWPDPERPWADLFVHPAEPRLERPPTPGEGTILQVDLHHRDAAGGGSWIRCQHCSTSIGREQEHVLAVVYLEGDDDWPHGTFKYAHFCDASCWAAWASSTER